MVGSVEDLGDPAIRVKPGRHGLAAPPVEQALIGFADVLLGRSGLEHRHLIEPTTALRCQRTAELGFRVGDQLLGSGFDLRGALGEQLAHLPGHPADLGLAVPVHPVPLHAEPGGELDPQGRLVHHPGRLELTMQRPRIERPPDPVTAADPSGNQDMGVQLRVPRSRRTVHERGCHIAVGVDLTNPGLALPRKRRVLLQVVDACGNRRGVGLADRHADLATGGGPQRRHGLRGGERQIPARHPIRTLAHVVERSEGLPRPGMHTVEQESEVLGCHLTVEPGCRRAAPNPLPWRLAMAGVVVLDPAGHRVGVVRHGGRSDLPPAQHRPPPSGRTAAGTAAQGPGTAGCQCLRPF